MGFFFRDGFRMLKKTFLAIIGLTTSTLASSGTMGPVCTPGNVTVPCETRLWDLGIQALYLRPIYSTSKAYSLSDPAFFVEDVDILHHYAEQKINWGWGFRAEGAFHFNTGDDITVDWTHYSNDTGIVGSPRLVPLFDPGVLLEGIGSPYSLNKTRFDQVNLVLGQHVDVGLVKKMRFYGGLQYANIQSTTMSDFSDFIIPVAFLPVIADPATQIDHTDFKGVGPVAGIDYSYNLTEAFSVTANGAASVLYGTSRYHVGYVNQPLEFVYSSASGAYKAIVPALSAKLGLNYAVPLAQGLLNIEGGYQAVNYFSVLQTQPVAQLFTPTPIANSDFGLYGPYFGVKYLGNA